MKKKGTYLIAFFMLSMFVSNSTAQSKFKTSISFDPKMMTVGPYEHSEKGEWNLLFRFAYRKNHFEYSIFLESFEAISYGAIGVNANYLFLIPDDLNRFDRWELGVGPGFGVIYREELLVKEYFFEFNGEGRYFFNKHLGLMLLGNLKYRSDLVVRYDEKNPWRLSAFFGLVYRW